MIEQVRALEGDKPIEPPIEDRLRALFRQRAEDFLVQAGEELRAPAGAGRGKAAALGQAAADCIRAESLLRSPDLREVLRGAGDLARADVEAAEAQRVNVARFLFKCHRAGIALSSLEGWVAQLDMVDLAQQGAAEALCLRIADQILTPRPPS
jgi:hypothetical protein